MADEGVKKPLTAVVYCGARPGKNPVFGEKAAELGAYLASRGVAVVYGGSRFGCLGRLADAIDQAGGKLTGILPAFFTELDGYSAVGEVIVVADMHARKKMFFERADVFIALPGGVGTIEELTEMLTWSKLGIHNKPTGLLNVDGYYDAFLHWLSRGQEEGFIGGSGLEDLLAVSDSPQLLVDSLIEKCHTTPSH